VAADSTVTVAMLRIAPGNGQIIVTTPTLDPNDPIDRAKLLDLVSPFDLVVRIVAVILDLPNRQLLLDVEIENTGQASILGIQVHATLGFEARTNAPTAHLRLARGVTLEEGKKLPLDRKTVPIPDPQPRDRMTLQVMGVGVGPGNNLPQGQDQREIIVPV
jgi:hypothetical protein